MARTGFMSSRLGQLLPLISLLVATVAAVPSPPGQSFSKRVPADAVSLGCYLDNAGGKRALEARSYASDDMTVDSCGAFCRAAKFSLFAVTYGRECFCGDAVSDGNTAVASGDCSFPCAGDAAQTCGAGNRINLYSFSGGATPVPVRGPATSLPDITSLGCVVDTATRIFPFKITDADDMTAAKCAVNCAGYPYFGTQWSRECYCGTAAPTVPAPASECSMPCSGDDNELCGAGMRLNAYQFGSVPTPTPSESASTSSAPTATPSAPAVDGFEYQGCYTDNVPQRVLAGKLYVEAAMTLAKCAASCRASQYGWFGLTYGTECYCGASLDSHSAKVPEVQCAMPCSGDSSETCGDSNRLNVYKDPALALPTANNLATVGEFSYKSCWTDDTANRSLMPVDYRTDDMTVEKCAARCADYLYFGLEYSRECYCGNELGGQAAPADECSMLCVGSSGSQWCGGPNRLNLYSKAVTSSSTLPASSSVSSSTSLSTSHAVSSSAVSESSLSSSTASTTSSSHPSTISSESSSAPTSSEKVSSSIVTSSTSTLPSSTSFSSSSTLPSSTTSSTSTTTQGPSLTTITSCPPEPTIADVPEMCYYPKLPTPCDKLTSSTLSRSMSSALRSCQSTLTSWGMAANPVATACFPITTAANPPNAAAASSTVSSVWSCLQSAGVLCNVAADCSTKTYTVGQVPAPAPTVGVDLLGDGGFESGTYGNWTLSDFNQHLVPTIQAAGRRRSGNYALNFYFPNTNGMLSTIARQVSNIEAGKPYQLRYWFYHENAAALLGIYQYVYPVGATYQGTQIYQTPTGVWTQRIMNFTPTSTFLNIRISPGGNVLSPNGGAQGRNNVYIDDIELIRVL